MTDLNCNRRQFLARASLALSLPAISSTFAESSGGIQCLVYDDQGQPLAPLAWERFHLCDSLMRPFTAPFETAGNRGEAMAWHNDFTENVQAHYVESVYPIAYSKLWVEAITYWDFNGVGHDGFIRADGMPRESYHRLMGLFAKRGKPA